MYSIEHAYNKFIKSRVRACMSENTVRTYEYILNPFMDYVGRGLPLNDLSMDDIELYIDLLLDKSLSKATVATYIRHIRSFMHFCEPLGVGVDYKEISVPRSPKRKVRIYTPQEMQMIFDAVTASPSWIAARNKAMIALMYDSGLRQCELCSLRRVWIPSDCKTIKVRGKGDKERIVPLGVLSASLVGEYLKQCPFESPFVFVTVKGGQLTTNAVRLMMSKLADNVPFELSSHKLRHNFATNWCIDQYREYGTIDIFRLQIIMGHDSEQTTKRYLHLAYEQIASLSNISHLDSINVNVS